MAIFVLESYVEMFYRVWLCALEPPGPRDSAVLITGQPGTGTSSITSNAAQDINRIFRQDLILILPSCPPSTAGLMCALLFGWPRTVLFCRDTVYFAGVGLRLPTAKSSYPEVFI
ncbi:hypothetical protein BU17DRAFT_86584 [Hysterangium stoloniferum]|nr:hypothetical protein BU17DRAFT_86584 [Hysterangium stoloniferum]